MSANGVLLENISRIAYDTCVSKMKTDNRDPIEVRLCDFDDTIMKIFIPPEGKNFLYISISVPNFAELESQFKVSKRLSDLFGDLIDSPQSGYDFTLKIDLDNLPKDVDSLISKIARLRSLILGAPYYYYFDQLKKNNSKSSMEPKTYNIRKDTVVYIFPGDDRVTLIHSINFNEKSDKIIAKVFLQEFQEGRRRVPQAPICNFSLLPPAQMVSFGMNVEEPTGNFGWLTFAVLNKHVQTEAKCLSAVNLLTDFRSYLQYHIKCSKAHFHQRMRARVVSLLQVLNRAHMEEPGEQKKKTMSGRTFTKQ